MRGIITTYCFGGTEAISADEQPSALASNQSFSNCFAFSCRIFRRRSIVLMWVRKESIAKRSVNFPSSIVDEMKIRPSRWISRRWVGDGSNYRDMRSKYFIRSIINRAASE